jgi:hypothetical protein
VSRLDDCKHDLVLPRWNPTDSRRVPDGKVCLNAEGELAVTKFAVEPVSFPGTYT